MLDDAELAKLESKVKARVDAKKIAGLNQGVIKFFSLTRGVQLSAFRRGGAVFLGVDGTRHRRGGRSLTLKHTCALENG